MRRRRTGSHGVVYLGKLPRGTRAMLRARIGFYLHKESGGVRRRRTGSHGVVYLGKLPRGTRAMLRARIGFYLHKESPGG